MCRLEPDVRRRNVYDFQNSRNATNYSNSEMAMLNQQWNDMSTHGVVSMDKIVDSAYDLTSMMPIAVDKVKGLTQAVVDYSQATQSSMQREWCDNSSFSRSVWSSY